MKMAKNPLTLYFVEFRLNDLMCRKNAHCLMQCKEIKSNHIQNVTKNVEKYLTKINEKKGY